MWQIGAFVLIVFLSTYIDHTVAGRVTIGLALVMLGVATHYYTENKRIEKERDDERNKNTK